MKELLLPQFDSPPLAPLYVFVDEHGNLDFSPSGTKYLILTALSCQRPFWWYPSVASLRFDIIEELHLDLERFHATEDAWPTKQRVFSLIGEHCAEFRLDSVIIEKRKAHPKFQEDSRFYPEHLGILLDYVITGWSFKHHIPETIVITDRIPHRRKRSIIERALKSILKRRFSTTRYHVYHHDSKSNIGLQVVDYCCWAIQRKWVEDDTRSFKYISGAISKGSEFEIFRGGDLYYY